MILSEGMQSSTLHRMIRFAWLIRLFAGSTEGHIIWAIVGMWQRKDPAMLHKPRRVFARSFSDICLPARIAIPHSPLTCLFSMRLLFSGLANVSDWRFLCASLHFSQKLWRIPLCNERLLWCATHFSGFRSAWLFCLTHRAYAGTGKFKMFVKRIASWLLDLPW